MSERTKITIAVLLENTITIICFTILAIVFGKWWIALFSGLLLSSLKWKRV